MSADLATFITHGVVPARWDTLREIPLPLAYRTPPESGQ